jgi:hypothetical protein
MPDPAHSSDHAHLAALLRARHPLIFIPTLEDDHALALVTDLALPDGLDLLAWSAVRGLGDGRFREAPGLPETEHPAAALFHVTRRLTRPTVIVFFDLIPHLAEPRTLRALREAVEAADHHGHHLVLIDHEHRLPPSIAHLAVTFELALPDAPEIEKLIRAAVNRANRHKPVVTEITRRTLDAMTQNLRGLTRRQIERIVMEAAATDGRFDASDLTHMVAMKRRMLAGGDALLEFIEAPASLDEIGGLANLKRWLAHRTAAFDAKARDFGLRPPRGILLLGVQGAGKSLCAKAIATAWKQPLLRLDPGGLYDRYIGESERRLRDALHQAERMSPIVLWIDEIEKGFASAASHSTDGGLSQRMFGTLLTWMQEHEEPVFLVATANDIEALPPELLRKGRFDEIFFVDLPTKDVRRQIFEIHIKKHGRDLQTFDLDQLADVAEGFSGAEIEQAVIASMHEAFAAGADIDTPRLLTAIRTSPPLSVTMAERVQSLRDWARGRCVCAD